MAVVLYQIIQSITVFGLRFVEYLWRWLRAPSTSSDGGVQDRECLVNRFHIRTAPAPRDVAQ